VGAIVKKKILYIQYVNPAIYPPLEHSSRIFADRNWEVLFVGTRSYGQSDTLDFEPHPRVTVKRLRYQAPGPFQKAHFFYFALVCLWSAVRNRPSYLYASDIYSTPVALVIATLTGIKVIYHEHDIAWPSGPFGRLLSRTRLGLCRRAEILIFPSLGRVSRFRQETKGIYEAKTVCVYNCPSMRDVKPLKSKPGTPVKFYYHGSINPERFPAAVLYALSKCVPSVRLTVVGFEMIGSQRYLDSLKQLCGVLKIAEWVEFVSPLAERTALLERCAHSHVGIAFMPKRSGDPNHASMAGASNKPFDYLSCGLALLVADIPEWEEIYVRPGYGIACDPDSIESLHAAMRRFIEHPEETRRMGEDGRARILADWNYEKQFRPVLERMEGTRK
jgi:glycosyltransferase involved in cell wall biosynthesis